jgi:hypothetical protein
MVLRNSPHPALSLLRMCCNMKKQPFGDGERRSGGKDLERQPLTVSIQGLQPYDNIQFQTNARLQYLKDPHSISLEPDCLSPQG